MDEAAALLESLTQNHPLVGILEAVLLHQILVDTPGAQAYLDLGSNRLGQRFAATAAPSRNSSLRPSAIGQAVNRCLQTHFDLRILDMTHRTDFSPVPRPGDPLSGLRGVAIFDLKSAPSVPKGD